MEEYIGFLAAFCTTVSFIPQAVKVIRTRDTHSISLWMYIIFTCGVLCWLIYGISLENRPMMIANTVTLVLSGTILVMKCREKK